MTNGNNRCVFECVVRGILISGYVCVSVCGKCCAFNQSFSIAVSVKFPYWTLNQPGGYSSRRLEMSGGE